jgi:hypothetical protein
VHNVEQTPAFKSYFDLKRADRNLVILGSVLTLAVAFVVVRVAEGSDNIIINGGDGAPQKAASLRYQHVD